LIHRGTKKAKKKKKKRKKRKRKNKKKTKRRLASARSAAFPTTHKNTRMPRRTSPRTKSQQGRVIQTKHRVVSTLAADPKQKKIKIKKREDVCRQHALPPFPARAKTRASRSAQHVASLRHVFMLHAARTLCKSHMRCILIFFILIFLFFLTGLLWNADCCAIS
jgi:hypothetical protein